MNKKFFAALASATMAFTASGSIAVFADDFVEENNPIISDGDVKPVETEVVWNEDNFGALVKLEEGKFTDYAGKPDTLVKGKTVKTADLAKVTKIDFADSKLNGEIKGLEYFTGLTEFKDDGVTKFTNKTLDFSANTALTTLKVTTAEDLSKITLPKPEIKKEDDKEKEVYHLATLELTKTALTSLDLSEQEVLCGATGNIQVYGNENLKDVVLSKGTSRERVTYHWVNLKDNALETIDLTNTNIDALNLSGNHIGALDLSTTNCNDVTLSGQKFYVSETLNTVNLAETFENFDKAAVSTSNKYDEKTGVLTIEGADANYEYDTKVNGSAVKLGVQLITANPMNRLYNPNSGEHFYTANIKEKEALVKLGWNDEGYGWVAPKNDTSGKTVYRLYNPNAGDHHYTVSAPEKNTLVSYGWKFEGEGWKSAENSSDNVRVFRQYNPYANGAGSHNYTTDKAENDYLVSLGWTPEGTAWFALQ